MDRFPTALETRFMEVVSSYLPDLVEQLKILNSRPIHEAPRSRSVDDKEETAKKPNWHLRHGKTCPPIK